MQIVIDIPEDVYKPIIKAYKKDKELQTRPNLYKAIANGTILPKGHGDIVDIEHLADMFWDGNSMEITKYDLSVIEPIIKADREVQDADSN